MDDTLREAPPADSWRQALAHTIDQQRQRVGERIASQRERLRELEARLAAQLDEAAAGLARREQQIEHTVLAARAEETELGRRLEEIQRRQDELTEEGKQLAAQQQAFSRREADLAQRQIELKEKAAALQERSDALMREREELTAARQAHEASDAKLRTQLDELHRRESGLKLKEQSLAERERNMLRQRRQVAQQLRARKKELAVEAQLNFTQAAAGAGQEQLLQQRLAELQARFDRLLEELDRSEKQLAAQSQTQGALVQTLQEQLAELRRQQEAQQAEFEQERKRLHAEMAATRQGGDAAAQLAKLEEANEKLAARLVEAEARARQGASSEQGHEVEDLRRRFEMAVQDVRELKTKNAELTEQLAKARQGGPADPAGDAGQGWEFLKQKMLAQLERDFDDNDAAQKSDKLTVQGAIKITDQVVAEKEHELQELRRLLESQAQQVGEVAVGAAAVAQLLDTDELIRQERDTLKQLQDSLREQLRKAEVDISLERAKLARERAELEERIRGWESDRPSSAAGPDTSGDKSKKGAGRKWLTRLGLGEGKAE